MLIEKISDTHLGNHQRVPFATVISVNKSFHREKKSFFTCSARFSFLGEFFQQDFILKH